MLAILALVMAASLQCQAGFPDGPEGLRGPTVVRKAQPEYTKEAIAARVEGVVVLSAQIGLNGRASDIGVVRGLGHGLDQKAVECLKKWRFCLRMKWGTPVAGYATVEIRFRLPTAADAQQEPDQGVRLRTRASAPHGY
jgi:TonB family protein